MEDHDSQGNPANELIKDASMGRLGQEKKNFYCLMLKNTITQQSVLYVPLVFDERELDYDQPFAQVTMFYLNIGTAMNDIQKRKWWSTNKKLAKNTLNEKRSNITCGLKKIFYGTYQD